MRVLIPECIDTRVYLYLDAWVYQWWTRLRKKILNQIRVSLIRYLTKLIKNRNGKQCYWNWFAFFFNYPPPPPGGGGGGFEQVQTGVNEIKFQKCWLLRNLICRTKVDADRRSITLKYLFYKEHKLRWRHLWPDTEHTYFINNSACFLYLSKIPN